MLVKPAFIEAIRRVRRSGAVRHLCDGPTEPRCPHKRGETASVLKNKLGLVFFTGMLTWSREDEELLSDMESPHEAPPWLIRPSPFMF